MKGLKRAVAFMLAVCMLIGMPIAINVSANDASTEPLKIEKAVVAPADSKSILVYFNKPVQIDTEKVKVKIGLTWNNSGGKADGVTMPGTSSIRTSLWDAAVVKEGAEASTRYRITITESATINDILGVKKAGTSPMVRFYDVTSGKNQLIEGVVAGTDVLAASGSCYSNGNINGNAALNTHDFADAALTTTPDSVELMSAMWKDDANVEVTFSNSITNHGTTGFSGIRLVDSNGNVVYYRSDSDEKYATTPGDGASVEAVQALISLPGGSDVNTVTLTETSTVGIAGFDAGSVKSLAWFTAHLEAAQAANSNESYRLAYVVEAGTNDQDEWMISGITSAEGNLPLSATNVKTADKPASVIVEMINDGPVTVNKVTFTSDKTIEVEFSQPVTLTTSGVFFGLRVIKNGGLYNGAGYQNYQTGLASKSGNAYDRFWVITTVNSITGFARDKYFRDDCSKTLDLCFAIEETGSGVRGDGFIDAVKTKDGKMLENDKVSEYVSGRENFYIPIQNDDFWYFTDSATSPKAQWVGESNIQFTHENLNGIGGIQVYLRAYDENGTLLKDRNDAAYQWPVTVTHKNGSAYNKFVTGTVQKAFGVDKYSKIVELLDNELDVEYQLLLTVVDNRVNGACEWYGGYNPGRVIRANAAYSTEQEDVGIINVVDDRKEAVTVLDVSIYDDETGKSGQKSVIITFSHDIDMDTFLNVAKPSPNSKLWLTVSAAGLNNCVDNDGEANTSAPAAQAGLFNLTAYGNTKNKVVAKINVSDFNKVVDKVNELNRKYDKYEYQIRLRIETDAANAGKFEQNYNIIPVDTVNVESPFLNQSWPNGGRIWVDTNLDRKIYMGSAVITSETTVDISFVDQNDNPAAVVLSPYFDNSGIWTGIRVTDPNNKLVYWVTSEGTQVAHVQLKGSMEPTSDPSVWRLTVPGNNLYDMYAAYKGSAVIGGMTDYKLSVCVEENAKGAAAADGVIDNFVTTPDGYGILQSQNTNELYRSYCLLSVPEDVNADEVTIDEVTIQGENTLSVVFSEPVTIDSSLYKGVRLINENHKLMHISSYDGSLTPFDWEIIDGQRYDHTPLQWSGSFVDNGDGKHWTFTLTQNRFNLGGLSDLIEYYNANWKDGGYVLAFGIESSHVRSNDGVVSKVIGKESNRSLIANSSAPAFSVAHNTLNGEQVSAWLMPTDAHYVALTEEMAGVLDMENPLTMQVQQISEHTLLATFSEAVTLNDKTLQPYIGLRLVDENNNVLRAHYAEDGTTIPSYSAGTYMQWRAKSYELINNGTQMLITFGDMVNISDIMNMTQYNLPASMSDYQIKLCIEETSKSGSVTDPGCVIANGKVWSVVSAANPAKQLEADKTPYPGTWDGAYVTFTALTPDTPIEIKGGAATITGENQLTFEWTEAVDMKQYYAAIRYVDKNCRVLFYDEENQVLTYEMAHKDAEGNTVNHVALQWSGVLNYTDAAKTKMTFAIRPGSTRFGITDLDALINPAADSEWAKIMALGEGKLVLCLEESGQFTPTPGVVDSFFGVDGKTIMAQPYIGAWNDGVYMDIKGDLIAGDLHVTSAKAVTDCKVIVSFSAPVEVLSAPYAALRVYSSDHKLLYYNTLTEKFTTDAQQKNADDQFLYTDADGNVTTEKSVEVDGEVVKNTPVYNVAMQWAGTWSYANEEHTELAYILRGRQEKVPVNNITEVMAYDWDAIGAYVRFAIEEQGDVARNFDGHVNNIVRADDARIALNGNFFPHGADTCRSEIEMKYTPNPVTAYAQVISDTQIRVQFSRAVSMGASYIAVRMVDNENNLMWSGKQGVSVPYQWNGTWEWENESHTSLVWTMGGSGIWGANNLYELLNWADALSEFKGQGRFCIIIEEKDTKDALIGRYNGLTECITALDGANHLIANASSGYDSLQMSLSSDVLSGDTLELESVTAIDDKTLEVKFNRGVLIKEGDEAVSMAIRYLTPSGDSEVLTDGRTAAFKGTWKYANEEKNIIRWTLNSPHTESLGEILTYGGMFEWNEGARIAFVIMDQKEEYYCPAFSMRINGVTDLDGAHHLLANYTTKDVMMTQMDITVAYDLPVSNDTEDALIEYVTNYVPYMVAAAVLGIAILTVAVIVFKRKSR